MNTEVTGREKRRSFFGAIAVAAAVMLIGAPVVQAAVQTVKVQGAVKVKDTNGLPIESEKVDPMGVLSAEGSAGAIAVRNFAGGTGFLGTGDCNGNDADSRESSVVVPAGEDQIITGIIITGAGTTVEVSAPELEPAIGPGAVNTFVATPENPNVFVGLGTGLTVSPAQLVFECVAGTGNFTILGQ